MKSEHRHELKTNQLERLATEWTHASETYVQNHVPVVIGAIVVAVVLLGGVIYWRTTAGSTERRGWQALADARTAADFATVADKFAGTNVATWARLQEAEAELYSGIRQTFTDRPAANSELKKAGENFEKLIADKSTPQDALERALFGLARTKEALPGDPKAPPSKINDPAISAYERLLERFPNSLYKPIANTRIDQLRRGSVQDFVAWFEKQNPKPADREMPKDLLPPPPEPVAPGAAAAPSGPKTDSSKAPVSNIPAAPASKSQAPAAAKTTPSDKSAPAAASSKAGK